MKWVTSGLLGLFLMSMQGACADEFRPLYVEISEQEESVYEVRIKTPPRLPAVNMPSLIFPAFCNSVQTGNKIVCRSELTGEWLKIDYPLGAAPHATVVRMSFDTGETHTLTLTVGELNWRVPPREELGTVAVQYMTLGIEHILIGFDHLLFVLCLIWISGSWRRILVTITGFTVAHSITLSLSAFEIIRLPVAPVEAVIALSVLFLAVEITRGRSQSLTWRYPVAVSASFGLLHGLGFAAVLSEIGLPQREVVSGLLFFNVGVEIGQVLFAAVVVLFLYLLNRISWFARNGRLVAGYLVGTISAYWVIERSSGFLL